jgi:hypothetical protein
VPKPIKIVRHSPLDAAEQNRKPKTLNAVSKHVRRQRVKGCSGSSLMPTGPAGLVHPRRTPELGIGDAAHKTRDAFALRRTTKRGGLSIAKASMAARPTCRAAFNALCTAASSPSSDFAATPLCSASFTACVTVVRNPSISRSSRTTSAARAAPSRSACSIASDNAAICASSAAVASALPAAGRVRPPSTP